MKRDTSTSSAGGPRIITLGSGCGGVGRTTLALELSKVLARRNVATLVVDCALSAPAVAPALSRDVRRTVRLARLFDKAGHLEDNVDRASDDGMALLTLEGSAADPCRLDEDDAARLIERLRRLEDDIVLIDAPPGPTPFWLDVMALSDAPVVVTGPEAWTVRSTVPFIGRLVERMKALEPAGRGRSYLLVNGCRDASERDLGEVLTHAIWRKQGHYPRYLGPVDHDDRRWFHLRHGDGCPPLSGSAGMGVQVEEVVKRILALDEFNQTHPRRPVDDDAASTRGTDEAQYLGMSVTASPADLRAQYRRLWEGYRRDSAISQELFGADERSAIINELERTYRALQMALDERTATPASSPATPRSSVPKRPRPRAQASAVNATQPVPAKGALDEPDDCGVLLARRRKAAGLSLRELSLHTRIGLRYLEAIERMDADALPPPVYLRGYLREIAKALELPVDSLLERYLSDLAEERERTSSGLGAR